MPEGGVTAIAAGAEETRLLALVGDSCSMSRRVTKSHVDDWWRELLDRSTSWVLWSFF